MSEDTKHELRPALPVGTDTSGSVTIGRSADEKLRIIEADELFVCSKASIESLLATHNKLIDERDGARAHRDELAESCRALRITLSGCNAALKALKRENDRLKTQNV